MHPDPCLATTVIQAGAGLTPVYLPQSDGSLFATIPEPSMKPAAPGGAELGIESLLRRKPEFMSHRDWIAAIEAEMAKRPQPVIRSCADGLTYVRGGDDREPLPYPDSI